MTRTGPKPAPVNDLAVIEDLIQLIKERIDMTSSHWRAGLGSLITKLETRHPGLVQERMAAQQLRALGQPPAGMPCV